MLRTAFAGALLVAGFAVVSCDGDGNKADANGKVKSDTALGKEFWLVRPMYFTTLHWSEDESTETASSTPTGLSVCPTALPALKP
ncbi:hypothetical protein BX264_7085 [Streptomyces sp. 2333.5]|nr:hypothetical protein BX264_7085 [Streptomyces sp. 2333.5]SEE96833.1 hypothetical protein SAMN05428943_7185 [Streptomyces sp. 2314.4]SEF10988.1 hypothetical protein SAMN05428942_7185 [Streptomyces sp. 2112.2]